MPALADQLKETEHFVAVVKANAADLPGLNDMTSRLEILLPQIKETSVRQATSQSDFLQATRELEALKKEANDLMVLLRARVKGTYGYRSDKLVEFRLKPLRRRPRIKAPEVRPPASQTSGGATS
jgi:DNA topoisomerase IB